MKKYQFIFIFLLIVILTGLRSITFAGEMEDQSISTGTTILIARVTPPMGTNGRPMRATMYGWETNRISSRTVPGPSRPPVRRPNNRSYWDNYYIYGPSWTGGYYQPASGSLPGTSVTINRPAPPREDRTATTVEERATRTVFSFIGAIKYNDLNRASKFLPPNTRTRGTKYINDRLGRVKDSRVLATKRTKYNAVMVKTQYLFNDGSGHWIPETKTFTVFNGMIINPL